MVASQAGEFTLEGSPVSFLLPVQITHIPIFLTCLYLHIAFIYNSILSRTPMANVHLYLLELELLLSHNSCRSFVEGDPTLPVQPLNFKGSGKKQILKRTSTFSTSVTYLPFWANDMSTHMKSYHKNTLVASSCWVRPLSGQWTPYHTI